MSMIDATGQVAGKVRIKEQTIVEQLEGTIESLEWRLSKVKGGDYKGRKYFKGEIEYYKGLVQRELAKASLNK